MNIIHPFLPSGFVTYCDDVRYEANGKISLIGIYTGEMGVFGTAPAMVPMLWSIVRFRLPKLSESTEIIIRISKDRDEEDVSELLCEVTFPVHAAEQTLNLSNQQATEDTFEMTEAQTHIRISPLSIEGPCTLRTRIFYNDDEYRIGAMNVHFVTPPDAPN